MNRLKGLTTRDSLEQVGTVLAGRTDVRRVIDQQLEHVERQIRMAQRLRKQLIAARDADDVGFAEIIRLTADLTGYLRQDKIDAMPAAPARRPSQVQVPIRPSKDRLTPARYALPTLPGTRIGRRTRCLPTFVR